MQSVNSIKSLYPVTYRHETTMLFQSAGIHANPTSRLCLSKSTVYFKASYHPYLHTTALGTDTLRKEIHHYVERVLQSLNPFLG